MELTVRNLKGATAGRVEQSGYHTKTTRFYIKSPQNQHNIMLSIPHRFFVLALRRGASADYSTLGGLLVDDKRNIIIKEQFLDQPVVVAGTHRGLEANMAEPVLAHSLSEYLKTRGQRMGYEDSITFYSIRRRAGTDFTKILGPEGARELMCHETPWADSRTLEKFYLELRSTTDVSAIGLGESSTARADEMELESSKLALSRLGPKKVAERCGKELNALFRQILVQDDDYRNCKTLRERKNRERVLRRCALASLIAEAQKEQESTITVEEHERRKDEILRRATDFNRRLLERIKEASGTPAASQASQESLDLDKDDSLGDDDFDEEAEEDDYEPDVDDQLAEGQNTVHVPEEQLYSADMADYVQLLVSVTYKDAVKSAMSLMLENGLNDYSKAVPRQCPLCPDDDSMREQDGKYKVWQPEHLPTHLKRQVHSKSAMFLREARNRMIDEGEEAMRCHICYVTLSFLTTNRRQNSQRRSCSCNISSGRMR